MIRSEAPYKLIYHPCRNIRQLFDPGERSERTHNCAADLAYPETRKTMEQMLIENLYGNDLAWIKDGELTGFVPGGIFTPKQIMAFTIKEVITGQRLVAIVIKGITHKNERRESNGEKFIGCSSFF